MMKFFVNARFLSQPISGVQRYGIECSRQIKRINPNIIFLAPKNILHKDVAEELEVHIAGTYTGQLWEQTDLPKYAARNGGYPLLNLANTAPLTYSNNYITLHDLAFYHHPEWNTRAFSAWYNFLIPRVAKKARHLFTVSETMRAEIIKYYKIPADKVTVTGNGLPEQMLLADKTGCGSKEKIILSVGSFNARKNHVQLIKAFMASGLSGQYRLLITGDKNKVFRETGLDEETIKNNNIELLHGVTDDVLKELYCKAEVVVSLSAYEGFGIPVLEGLYFGCKALCSDIPVYRELYDKYAYFCDPHQVSNITLALEKALGSADNRQDISALTDRYNYKRSAEIIIEQIEADTHRKL